MTDVVPPTTFLPPLKLLKTCSGKEIWDALASLRYIYLPEVRGCSRRRRGLMAEKQSNDLSAIRADGFERSFAIQWLTRFVSLFSEVGDDVRLLQKAASLLAICAGAAASGSVDSPKTVEGGMNEFTVLLRDAPLESSDFSSVGAQTWGGSCILAEMIAENPSNLSIFSREQLGTLHPHVNAPFRALELGAGTGLASLVLGKVLERIRSMDRQCEEPISFDTRRVPLLVDTVFATDFHPSVLANLRFNFAVNFPAASINSQSPVLANNADILTSVTPSSTSSIAPQLDIPFDVIIEADITYEHSHALWVRACVERFLRKPTRPLDTSPLRTDQCPIPALFHLIIPLRRTHAVESPISPYADAAMEPIPLEVAIISQEDILCDAYSDCDTEEEVVYRYDRIGWV
ncbi:hypothetical protein JB92DRAFT_2814253 [Gautieria morchelliformis]|nr:hypothetical protein JB92DRAFT_2814253 [Gautieria morchelliformis]